MRTHTLSYLENVPTASESIEDFFARYTGYLTAGDIEGLAGCYNYPALAVTAMGCLAITDRQQSRDFFAQGQGFYRSQGIVGVRPRDIVTDVEVPGIWVGRLALQNLDGTARPRARNATPTKWLLCGRDAPDCRVNASRRVLLSGVTRRGVAPDAAATAVKW